MQSISSLFVSQKKKLHYAKWHKDTVSLVKFIISLNDNCVIRWLGYDNTVWKLY